MLPRGWDRRTTVFLAFVFLFLCRTSDAFAQVLDLERDRVQMADLHGFWRFHPGDDPDGKLGWSEPSFDDSSWKLKRADQPTSTRDNPNYGGMSWYRLRVALPPNHPPLAIYIPEMGTSYEVFVGGRLIGQFGGIPPDERPFFTVTGGSLPKGPPLGQVVTIPPDVEDGTNSLVVAIRVWTWPDWSFHAPNFQPLSIGDASLLNDKRQQAWNHQFWSLSADNALLLGYLLAALAALGLFLLRPGEGEYLWFAAIEVLHAAMCIWDVYPVFRPVWYRPYVAADGVLLLLRGVCFSMFFVTLLKQPRNWLFWTAIASTLFGALMFVPGVMGWMSYAAWVPVIVPSWLPFVVCQLLMITLPALRGNLDARLLLFPFGIQYGTVLVNGLIHGVYVSGHGGPAIAFWARHSEELFHWPFPISIQNIADLFTQISILSILVLRFARTRRYEEMLSAEMEAARTVQQILIPNEIPAIPGFAIGCVYQPAGHVGGDFFQVLPIRDGGVLIVIGDVSGKGLPAAMAVSLLVGTVRTLAHYTHSPGEILAAMNQRMLARSKDGFTTCLVVRIHSGGTVTVSNAGHLPPYAGSRELAVENGLPLGLVADFVYPETEFHLAPEDQLTLITDGVVEARGKTRELFGFDRTAAISGRSAEEIANAAIAFGQEDDVTVLTIRRAAFARSGTVPVATAVSVASTA
jgi:hypothetical protein